MAHARSIIITIENITEEPTRGKFNGENSKRQMEKHFFDLFSAYT